MFEIDNVVINNCLNRSFKNDNKNMFERKRKNIRKR